MEQYHGHCPFAKIFDTHLGARGEGIEDLMRAALSHLQDVTHVPRHSEGKLHLELQFKNSLDVDCQPPSLLLF